MAQFLTRLDRVDKYLSSSKLHFRDTALDLNPLPFHYACEVLPPHSPLTYLLLWMREPCWSEEDLESRKVLAKAIRLYCMEQLDN
jgi:hypothetical protein